jgi:hypothetical protein
VALDVVAVHSMSNIAQNVQKGLEDAKSLSITYKKLIIFESFGYPRNPGKANFLQKVLSVCVDLKIPWLVWQVSIPNNNGDYEIYIQDSDTWQTISSYATLSLAG